MGRAFLVPFARFFYGMVGGLVGALCVGTYSLDWPLGIALVAAGILIGRALGGLEAL